MQSISQLQLQSMLMLVSSSTFASLATVTDPAMRKTGNPFRNKARKVTFSTVTLCWYYKNARRRRQAAAGETVDFQPKPRRWGTRIPRTPLVAHRVADECRSYVEAKVTSRHEHYFDRNTGRRIRAEDLIPYLKPRKDDPDRPSDYRLASIAEITIDQIRYSIAPAADELQHYFPPIENEGQPGEGAVA